MFSGVYTLNDSFMNLNKIAHLILSFLLFAVASVHAQQRGIATYYSRSAHGALTANGERHDSRQLVCAHRSLPFGTRVRVTDLLTHKTVIVRVNDRGPHIKNIILDLSYEAARRLGILRRGRAQVKMEVIK
jgi:rare lipoprotein A